MKKVAIIGFGPGWTQYPQDYDGEVWSLNMGAVLLPRIDKLFLADKLADKTSIRKGWYEVILGPDRREKVPITEEGYKGIIAQKGLPFISCHPYPDVPTYEPYPLREIVDHFGGPPSAYFANCIAYMLAYAIWKQYEEIEVWGVIQGMMTEYAFHKGSIEFWLGIALGRGIGIKIAGESRLLKTFNNKLYGFNKPIEELIK